MNAYFGRSSRGSELLITYVLLGAVGLLATLGLVLVTTSWRQATFRSARVGDEVRTSFGVLAVAHRAILRGPSGQSLAGMTHGIQSLVSPEDARVEVTVGLTNLLERPVRYSPRQFHLVAGSRRYEVAASNVRPGTLQPDANIEMLLSFVAPRDGDDLRLAFDDAGEEPVLVSLGAIGTASPDTTLHSHHHH